MTSLFHFAVIADSHFRLPGDDPQSSHPSDAGHNDRNRRAVAQVVAARPAHIVHLGDVPHPVPGLAAHGVALDIAKETYAAFGELGLTVVPGNHDVGDKPRPWANAPGVGEDEHRVFTAAWGAPWGSFDLHGVHFVWLDTPILNTGSQREEEQWAWLEADLETAGTKRCFVFVHYPPYLCEPREPEHYDNLAEPGRSRLLGLLEAHGVEALFAGHVHNVFFDRLGDVDLHVLPSSAFVRPEYAELADVGPGGEYGRDDPAKLGFALIHVKSEGYELELVRTEDPHLAPLEDRHPALLPGLGATPPGPLGASLRHDWSLPREVPFGNLDEFHRKEARQDGLVHGLWDAGITRLRVPAGDLAHPRRLARMEALAARGARFLVFSTGVPDAATAVLVGGRPDLAWGWEVIVPRPRLAAAVAAIDAFGLDVPTWVSRVGGERARDGQYFSHFPEHGFLVGEGIPELGRSEPVLRVPPDRRPWEALAEARPGVVRLQLPRAGEGVAFTDDRAVALRVAEAAISAWAHPHLAVFLDTLVDHDRGYYPRNGLLDRRCNPRPALFALRHLARLLPERRADAHMEDREQERVIAIEGWGTVHLPRESSTAAVEALDLVSGARLTPGRSCSGPWATLGR
ncbi:MAG TPA: metallophosphoesterase [Myxococcota bacterium]|nr:metallophosphoesterase [Myxococcota bacterium]